MSPAALTPWRSVFLLGALFLQDLPGLAASPTPQVTSLTPFSCAPRAFTHVCNLGSMGGTGIGLPHRGSELNDGAFFSTRSDEECCRKCQETPGCKSWSRNHSSDKFGSTNNCWLKSSVSTSKKHDALTSGVVGPVVVSPMPCRALDMVGFKGAVPYNDPEQLHATSPEDCCNWCQADSELCYGWSWSAVDERCKLYGTPITEKDHYLCRGCVSGVRTADREKLIAIEKCTNGGQEHAHYQGAKNPVVIAPKESFKTVSSRECCGICESTRECKSWSWNKDLSCYINGDIPEAEFDLEYWGGVASIKVCNPEPCDVVNQIKIVGADLYKIQPLVPAGDSIVVGSPEECCKRCQEYPECVVWTFVEATTAQLSSECRMKSRFPADVTVETAFEVSKGEQMVVTGYIKSRVTSSEIEHFLRGVKYARNEAGATEQKDANSLTKATSPSILFILPVAIIGSIVCCFLTLAVVVYRRSNVQKKIINEAREIKVATTKTIPKCTSSLTAFGSIFEHCTLSDTSQVFSNSTKLAGDLSICSESIDWATLEHQSTAPASDSARDLEWIKESYSTKKRSFNGLLSFQSVSEQNSIPLEAPVGTTVAGKYIIEPGYRMGENSHVLNATQKFGHAIPVVLKFYFHDVAFDAEREFFSQRLATNNFIPQVFDVFDAETVETWGLPPMSCIVIERGEQTLAQWLGRCTRTLDTMDQRGILYKICCAVQSLHDCGIVHRDLKPDNIVLFSSSFTWKLIDFGSWGKRNRREAIQYSLHYAPPEVITAHASNEHSIIVKPAADMWSLGLIFWEILTGEALFDMDYTEDQVLSALLGAEPLPFEKEPKLWAKIEESSARRLVAHLLQRNPDARWTIRKVINNAYFSPGSDTIQIENSRKRVSGILSSIAESIQRVEGRVQQATEIAFENLKHTVGNVLLLCFSFYEVSDEAAFPTLPDDDIVRAHIEGTLPCTQALLEPKYNVFKRAANDPVSLLRLEKKHLLKITIMYGADIMMELPISEILFCRLFPSDAEEDSQEITMIPFCEGNLGGIARHSIGVWDTPRHEDIALRLVGKTSVVIVVGFRLLGSDTVVEVRKSLEVSMHPPDEQFRLVKMFYRTQEWYSNLPDWAKVYIHGAVSVVKLSSNVL